MVYVFLSAEQPNTLISAVFIILFKNFFAKKISAVKCLA